MCGGKSDLEDSITIHVIKCEREPKEPEHIHTMCRKAFVLQIVLVGQTDKWTDRTPHRVIHKHSLK